MDDEAIVLPPKEALSVTLHIVARRTMEPSGIAFEGESSPSCAACRHWERLVAVDCDVREGVFGIPRQEAKERWGACQFAIYEGYGRGPRHPNTTALAFDGEEYAAGLMTRDDHGCTQWQPKERN